MKMTKNEEQEREQRRVRGMVKSSTSYSIPPEQQTTMKADHQKAWGVTRKVHISAKIFKILCFSVKFFFQFHPFLAILLGNITHLC